MDGFYVLFNRFQSYQSDGRVRMKKVSHGPPFTVKWLSAPAGLEPWTARSAGWRLTY